MDAVRRLTVWYKVAVGLEVGSLLFHLIGFCTSYWYYTRFSHTGLWRRCDYASRTRCADMVETYNVADWHRGVQAMETLGLIFLSVGMVLVWLYVFASQLHGNRALISLNISASFLAACFIIIGVVIVGIKVEGAASLSWSFALCVVAAALALATAIIFFIESRK